MGLHLSFTLSVILNEPYLINATKHQERVIPPNFSSVSFSCFLSFWRLTIAPLNPSAPQGSFPLPRALADRVCCSQSRLFQREIRWCWSLVSNNHFPLFKVRLKRSKGNQSKGQRWVLRDDTVCKTIVVDIMVSFVCTSDAAKI